MHIPSLLKYKHRWYIKIFIIISSFLQDYKSPLALNLNYINL